MEDIVHIYGLVRFVTGFLERGEEAKKNHEAANTDIFNAPDRKFKERKVRDAHFLFFATLLLYQSKILHPLWSPFLHVNRFTKYIGSEERASLSSPLSSQLQKPLNLSKHGISAARFKGRSCTEGKQKDRAL